MRATFERELQQWQEHERRHQLVEETARVVHEVALFDSCSEHIEQLLCHEVALVVRVKRIHTRLDYVCAQLSIIGFRDFFDVRDCAEAREKISHARCQVQVIEEVLDKVFLGDDVLQELLGALD